MTVYFHLTLHSVLQTMSTKLLVYGYINHSCLILIPIVLYEMILLFFDSTDKFDKKSLQSDQHLVLSINQQSIKKISCNNLNCRLNQIAFLTQIIHSNCYHWIFKMCKIPYDCSIGIFNKCNNKITERESIFVTLDCIDAHSKFENNDILEMVLNFADNILLFFKHDNKCVGSRLLIYSFEIKQGVSWYMAGVHFTGGCCEDGLIEIMESGYIDAPTSDNYKCFKTFLR